MKYFKLILSLVCLFNLEHACSAAAEPEHDLFMHVARAVQHSTGLPNNIVDLAARYYTRPPLQEVWRSGLPAHYLNALVTTLSDGTIVACAQNGDVTTLDIPHRIIISKPKLLQADRINCIEVLPDDTVIAGDKNGSLHFVDVEKGKVSGTFVSDGPIKEIAYVESNAGEGELFISEGYECMILNSNTLLIKDFLPAVVPKSVTRLSKNKIVFSGIFEQVSPGIRQVVIYNANPGEKDRYPYIGMDHTKSNSTAIARCGKMFAIAHACNFNAVSFWDLDYDECRSPLAEKMFNLRAKYPPSCLYKQASLTSLGNAVAVNDGGTVHIIDEKAELLQTLPGDNIRRTFPDGNDGLITIRQSKGLLRKKAVIIAHWKSLTFQEQAQQAGAQ